MTTASMLLVLALVGAQSKSPCPADTEMATRKEKLGEERVTRYMCKTADGTVTGPFVVVYDNNKYAQSGTYDKKGKLHGEFFHFNKQGQKLARTEFVHGAETGERRSFFATGELETQGPVKNGKAEGLWTFFHQSGAKRSEGPMKNGWAEGVWTHWDEAGYVLKNGPMLAGTEDGIWVERASRDELFTKLKYEDGRSTVVNAAPAATDGVACSQVSAGWWVLQVSDLGRIVAGWPDGLGQAKVEAVTRGGEVYGYRIGDIRSGSMVASCGFQNGDVIRAVNDVQTKTVSAFATAADRARARGTAVFHLERDHRIVLVRIEKR